MENVGSCTAAPTTIQPVLTGHVHGVSVGRVTQQQREIQPQMVKAGPDEAPGTDSQTANAFDFCRKVMKVPKSESSSGPSRDTLTLRWSCC